MSPPDRPTAGFHLPPYLIRPMVVEDIPSVMVVDALAYSTPWKEAGYQYELTGNQFAYYDVLVHTDTGRIWGYCGFWLMAGECHISTIAVHPDWQGQGFGELLFWNMQRQACLLQATLTTLEVRQSNQRAQALYRKYGLVEYGRRIRYYSDTHEDALIMTLSSLDEAYCAWLEQRIAGIEQRLRGFTPRRVYERSAD